MSIADKYAYKGDYVLTKIDLISHDSVTVDLIPLFSELNVFESIFSNTMSGNVVIVDAQGVFDTLRLHGGETIEVGFYTTGKPDSIFEKTFTVLSISDFVEYNQTTYMYVLNFVSQEELKNKVNVIKEAYTGTVSDIAKQAFEKLDSEKEFDVEETMFLNDFIIPFWSPFDTINWLSKRAISVQDERSGFLFFENRDGFHFKSIQSLYKNDSDLEYVYTPNNEENINTYRDFEINNPNFLIEKLHNKSLYGCKTIFDVATRSFIKEEETYTDNFNENSSLDEIGMPTNFEYDDLESNSIYVFKDKLASTNEDLYEKNAFKFNSVLSQSNNNSVTIAIPGNTDITVGYNADCKMLKTLGEEGVRYLDFYFRKMLISEIRHTLKGESYNQTVTLIKDSYGASNG